MPQQLVRAALVAFAVLASTALAQSETLARRADFGMSIAPPGNGEPARIVRVRPDTPAARAGLLAGDEVLRLDDLEARDASTFESAYRRFRAGDTLKLQLRRGGQRVEATLKADPMRMESHEGLETTYGAARSARGYLVRTIVTRPADAKGRLPVLVFIPWLSCGSIENPFGPNDGWSRMLRDVMVKSGFAVLRVEKPGVSDSGGPDCSVTDLGHDMDAYRAGIRAALALPYVDAGRLYLFGGSIGAALAPILAQEFRVKGLVASGGFARAWSEHIMGFERRRLTLSGKSPSEVNAAMKAFADFYSLYLNAGLTPGEVIARRPDLRALWYDEPGHQFGRPARYYQQVQQLDVEGAWAKIAVPTLLVWGEFDWIMGREDQERILAIVRTRDPALIRFVPRPGMNHHFEAFADASGAYTEEGGRYDKGAAAAIVDWLRAREARSGD